MPLSKVSVNVGQGGLGRRALSPDGISGIIFYNDTLPTGFDTDDRIKKVFSVDQAIDLGIVEGSADHDVEFYHIDEFFRLNPNGQLWIGYFDVPSSTYDFTEINSMQTEANGEIRLLGIYAPAIEFASAQVTTIDTLLQGLNDDGITTLGYYAADFSSVATGWGSADDLRALTADNVTVVAAQDGGGAGAALFTDKGTSITALGAVMGAISRAQVNESIAFVANFNASNGIELEVPALANGDLVKDLTDTQLGAIKDLGYQIIIKRTPKIAGSYFERTPQANASTSDFAFNEVRRPVLKAVRLVDSALTPQLNATVQVNDDGTLTDDYIEYLKDIADQPLGDMENQGEISARQVLIDPEQDVNATSTVVVTIRIIPTGTAEFITVNIGLTTSL